MTFQIWPKFPVDRGNAKLSLHTRVGLVLTALAASLLLVFAGLWLNGTRNAIHEEVEAASRVSEQWLKAVLGEMNDVPAAARGERLLGVARAIGRVRANDLDIRTRAGETIYRSPAPTYKAGRTAPGWFAGLLATELPVRTLAVEGYTLTLRPDASRAILDAWDELAAMAGWALGLLGVLFVATRTALGRALRPLAQIMRALDRTGRGRFDTRLPVFSTPELGRISRAFNSMADRLGEAVDDNVRLESAREVDGSSPANCMMSWPRASPPCAPWPAPSSSAPATRRRCTSRPRASSPSPAKCRTAFAISCIACVRLSATALPRRSNASWPAGRCSTRK
jgi:two-component system sensor histidine kinase UhpB